MSLSPGTVESRGEELAALLDREFPAGKSRSAASLPVQTAPVEDITNGGRNNTLFKIACSMRRLGCDDTSIMAALEVEKIGRLRKSLGE